MRWMLPSLVLTGLLLCATCLADPGPSFEPTVDLRPPDLRRRQGLLLLDTHVARPVSSWVLEGHHEPILPPLGRHLELIALDAGAYRWTSIEVPYFDLPYRLPLSGSSWSFRIEPGAINYAGTLMVGESRGTDSVDVRLLNRSAEVLMLLRTGHSSLLERYPLIHTGNPRDDFLRDYATAGTDADH